MERERIPVIDRNELATIKLGDIVERALAGVVPVKLKVVQLSAERIFGAALDAPGIEWEFERSTGLEIDEGIPSTYQGLGDPRPIMSYLTKIVRDETA